jgi:squalene-hopene/tetraprenyl-beta-curcumene cyclase
VSRDALAWQQQHNCFGCHVQAVTVEALSVGRHHQYDVNEREFSEILRGILEIPGGHRQPQGLGVGAGAGMPATSTAFGGAAFAKVDTLVDARVRDDLLAVAERLFRFQNEDGSVRSDDTRFPVVAGAMQATTQAIQTWRVAYDRSAHPRWVEPIRRAETWMQQRARQISDSPDTNITEINYAVMGLMAAGAMPSEPVLQTLANRLRARQNEDGGWGFDGSAQRSTSAFATGQTLYSLRLLGMGDSDRVIQKGTTYLLEHQQPDGGWSHSGAGRAEAMWAVFGLVSIDVLSLNVQGIRDGQHASGTVALHASAVDNGGEAVTKTELVVDDVPVVRTCGSVAEYRLDTSQLNAGVHSVDVIATNSRGQTSRRRVEFYSGTHYLAALATRWENGATTLTWRDVAPANVRGNVRVQVFSTRVVNGAAVRDQPVWSQTIASSEGPMRASWNGQDSQQHALPQGRYVAEVSFVDASGVVVHRQESLFAHESVESQQQRYAEVAGTLNLPASMGNAANTQVELVDREGNVVQRTTTTAQGNYMFQNVDTGAYRVRVRRQGFRASELDVTATAPAAAPSNGAGNAARAAAPAARADLQLAF